MANKHFGELGDVWKHLILAKVLSATRPIEYWETHAGAAQYILTESTRRDCGARLFANLALKSKTLRSSKYYKVLKTCVAQDLPKYPGSPRIAMNLLQKDCSKFIFCDTDRSSLDDIREVAIELGVDSSKMQTLQADGIKSIMHWARRCPQSRAGRIVVLIDPYWPLEDGSGEMTALELMWYLLERGFIALLWYGGADNDRAKRLIDAMENSMRHRGTYAHFGVSVYDGDDALVSENVGLRNFGFAGGNLGGNVLRSCLALSAEMTNVYCRERDASIMPQSPVRLAAYSDLQSGQNSVPLTESGSLSMS